MLSIGQDQATLDLVVHMLGIATHDNINAAPSGMAPVESGAKVEGPQACHSFNAKLQDVGGVLLDRIDRRTVSNYLARVPGSTGQLVKHNASWLSGSTLPNGMDHLQSELCFEGDGSSLKKVR